MRTCDILENYNCLLLKIFRTASGTALFERGAIGFSSSIAFQNALTHHNQTITSEITLFLVIATICARFVISVFFSSVIDHDPPTQIHRYYGMILTFDNYGRPLSASLKFRLVQLIAGVFKCSIMWLSRAFSIASFSDMSGRSIDFFCYPVSSSMYDKVIARIRHTTE